MLQTKDSDHHIQTVLETVVKAIVDYPDQVRIVPDRGEQTLVFKAYAHRTDMGKIIGKKGTMASALRTMLVSMSVKYQTRCVLEIMDRD